MKLILIGAVLSSLSFFNTKFLAFNQYASSQKYFYSKSISVFQEKPYLSFSTSVKFGKQNNQLSVLISTDFDGNYIEESIKKATWKNFDTSIKLAAGEEFENSGPIDISNLVKKGQPFYIAFKYTGAASSDGKPTQKTWQVKDVKLSETDVINFNIVNSSLNGENVGWIKNKQGIIYRPNATLIASEGWAISEKVNF